MKKLSNILKESAWGDMMRRSSGEMVRREDILKVIYDKIISKYQICYVNMADKIEYDTDYIHIPMFKIINMGTYLSIGIKEEHITFSSISPNKYKTRSEKSLVSGVKNDLLNLYDKIESEYSPEISEHIGIDHWVVFKVYPNNGISYKFCEEFIDFILDNTPDNKNMLKILERK
jgi:hypothetical protein